MSGLIVPNPIGPVAIQQPGLSAAGLAVLANNVTNQDFLALNGVSFIYRSLPVNITQPNMTSANKIVDGIPGAIIIPLWFYCKMFRPAAEGSTLSFLVRYTDRTALTLSSAISFGSTPGATYRDLLCAPTNGTGGAIITASDLDVIGSDLEVINNGAIATGAASVLQVQTYYAVLVPSIVAPP